MSNYKRLRSPGGTYFFSVHLEDGASRLLVEEIDLLRNAVGLCLKQRPFVIDCAVVLPSRMHMIWTLPAGDADYSARWRQIKSTFSRHVPPPSRVSVSRAARGEKGIWQRRFWEHAIRDRSDLARHRAAILTAPVRAGLVERPQDWPHSSIHRDGGAELADMPPSLFAAMTSGAVLGPPGPGPSEPAMPKEGYRVPQGFAGRATGRPQVQRGDSVPTRAGLPQHAP